MTLSNCCRNYFRYSDTSVWTLPEVTLHDRGEYQCIVASPSGNHTATTFLEIRGCSLFLIL